MQSTDVCYNEKVWLRRQVRFRAAKEQKFDRAVNAQKIARFLSFHEAAARHPTVTGKSNPRSRDEAGGQAVGRPDPPAHERKISRMKAIGTTTSKFGVVWGGLTDEEKMKLLTLCEEKAAKEQIGQSVCARHGHRRKYGDYAG